MSIRVINDDSITQADIGKFACLAPVSTMVFCTGPRKISAVSKSRVYIEYDEDRQYVGGTKSYVQVSSVMFICDTKEEGEAVFELGMQQLKVLNEAEKQVRVEYSKKLKQLVVKYSQV